MTGALGVLFIAVISTVHGAFITKQINLPTKWNFTEYDKLRQDLLATYDKQVRPTSHNESITVSINFIIMDVEITELKSTITVSTWMPASWVDEKFRWSPSDYGGLKQIQLSHNEMWKPDLFLHNSPLSMPVALYGSRHMCVINYIGEVLCVPSIQMTALCDLNLKYWPFDEQECSLKIASWTHSWEMINLRVTEGVDPYLRDDLWKSKASEWTILNASQFRHWNKDEDIKFVGEYPDVTLTLYLARIPAGYKLVLFTSAFVMMCLILASFWLSVHSDSKMIVTIIAFIIGCMFLMFFNLKLPPLRTHTPLIVSFFSANLYMAAFAIIETTFLMWLKTTSLCRRELPWVLKKHVFGKLSFCLGPTVPPIQKTSSLDNGIMSTSSEPSCSSNGRKKNQMKRRAVDHDYTLLAAMVDRVFFCLYSTIYFALAIRYSI